MDNIKFTNYIEVFSESGPSRYQVIDFVPGGYEIWNIGRKNMAPGYLPLCRLKSIQPFPGCTEIETDTLKAIKIDGAELILDAIGGGCNTIEKMEKFIKKHQDKQPGTWQHTQVERLKKALPIMRKINWH